MSDCGKPTMVIGNSLMDALKERHSAGENN
jgi:hypothetical protein